MPRHYAYIAPERLYPAPVVIPTDRLAWWGGPDTRPRCTCCGKVAFHTLKEAALAAARATEKGTPMRAYEGWCGNFHTTRNRHARCD